MNEQDFAAKVKGHLDASTEELPPAVMDRLQSARQLALAQLQSQRNPAARTNGLFTSFTGQWKFAAPAFALVVLAVGYVAFNLFGDTAEEAIHELEAEMLNHALPPHAFIDEGFEKWLKRDTQP